MLNLNEQYLNENNYFFLLPKIYGSLQNSTGEGVTSAVKNI